MSRQLVNLRICGDIKPGDSSLLQGVLLVYHFLIYFRYNLLVHHSLFLSHTDFQSLITKHTPIRKKQKAYGSIQRYGGFQGLTSSSACWFDLRSARL